MLTTAYSKTSKTTDTDTVHSIEGVKMKVNPYM